MLVLLDMSAENTNNNTSNIPKGAFSFPKEEEDIIKHWDDVDAFQRTLELTKDLPPFAFLMVLHLLQVLLIMVIFWHPLLRISSHVMPL